MEASLIDLAWTSLEESEEFSLEGYKARKGPGQLRGWGGVGWRAGGALGAG